MENHLNTQKHTILCTTYKSHTNKIHVFSNRYKEQNVQWKYVLNNLGAEILGANAPGPKRKYYTPRDFEEYERDETFIPVDIDGNPTDGWVRPSDKSKSSEYGLTPLLTDVIWGFIVFMLIFLVCKYAKLQKSKT